MSTIVFWKYHPIGERTRGELARNGITKIELLESREQYDMTDLRSTNYVKEICDTYGIQIVAYYAHSTHFEGVDTEQKRKIEVDRCRHQIDTMIELGGKVWRSHAKTMNRTLQKSYEVLARHVEGTDVSIAIENFKAEEY